MATNNNPLQSLGRRLRGLAMIVFSMTGMAYGALHQLAGDTVFAASDTATVAPPAQPATPVAAPASAGTGAIESVFGASELAILARPAETAAARSDFYAPAARSFDPALEQQLFAYLNGCRAAAGLAPLTLDNGLTTIARTRSQQLIDQAYFAHTDPDGYTMYVELLGAAGYNWRLAGENLAKNDWPVASSAAHAGDALMASPAHCQNMLDAAYTRVGIGEVTAPDGQTHYFTMVFLG